MREIKFRAKEIDNGNWVYGYYCFNGWTDKQKHYIIPELASALYGTEVIPETVGQYTGIKDSKGIEIYEGDIVAMGNGKVPSKIYWDEDNSAWYFLNIPRQEKYELNRFSKKFISEVIGNIHDRGKTQNEEQRT